MVKHTSFPEKGNPYEKLGLPNFATQSQVKKKFRELSLKLHPDKRQPNLSQAQTNELDHQFITVQEARSFLIDDEFADEKQKYDAKLQSEQLRKEEDQRREEQMDGRRKRMRSDLEMKIEKELRRKENDEESTSVGFDADKWKNDKFEDLKKDGARMRESFHDRKQTDEQQSAARERKRRKKALESRQVRVKWSRKKMGGQSEHMLAKLLSRFGPVEEVELIGSKGNAALVTFRDEDSCKPCVDAYLHSEELRATFVGKSKEQRDEKNMADTDWNDGRMHMRRERDRESVEERKLRQAAEREALLRQMEMGGFDEKKIFDHENSTTPSSHEVKKSLFPPHFPTASNRFKGMSLMQRLEGMEKELLKGILSSEEIEKMQLSTG